jgi:hypothetical protein
VAVTSVSVLRAMYSGMNVVSIRGNVIFGFKKYDLLSGLSNSGFN